MQKKYMARHKNTTEIMALPQPMGKAAIFAPTVQNGSRIVNVEDSIWEIGVEDPDNKAFSKQFMRGFDVRHAQVIFGLLNYYHLYGFAYDDEVDMSYYKLMDICGFAHGKQDEVIKEILADLKYTTTAIRRGKDRILFNVIGEISKHQDLEKEKTTLKYIVFSRSFIDMLDQHQQFFSFYMSFWNKKLPSKIAQSLYIYLPSRAVGKSKEHPHKITLTNLLDQLGLEVPKFKSARKKIFLQNKTSILSQLNGAPVHHDKVLRAEITDTIDKQDYNLCVWTEFTQEYTPQVINTGTNLAVWWQCAGGSLRDYQERMRRKPHLDTYEAEKLKEAGINVTKDMTFLRMAKALLGSVFSEIAGSMCMLKQEERLNTPYPYLIGAIKKEIEKVHKQQELPFEEN